MPRRKAPVATLSSVINFDSDNDQDDHDDLDQSEIASMPTPESQEEEGKRPTKATSKSKSRASKKPKPTPMTAPAVTTSKPRVGSTAPTTNGHRKRARPALKDVTNMIEEENEEEGEDVNDEMTAEEPQPKRTKAASASKPKKTVKSSKSIPAATAAAEKEDSEEEEVEIITAPPPQPPPISKNHPPKSAAYNLPPPPQSYPHYAKSQSISPQRPPSRARSISRQPPESILRGGKTSSRHAARAHSACSTDRGGGGGSDPALRRRLGELTSKYESLEVKYNSLKEVAWTDAESNFDKLKASTELRSKKQETVLESLQKELAVMQNFADENNILRTQLAKLQAQHDVVTVQREAEKKQLSAAQNDMKILQAKLAVIRNQSETASASSSNKLNSAAAVVANSRIDDAKMMRMKEELYGDLTGLMIHNVKRVDGDNVFDCIQTGRNGTLRFHLAVEDPTSSSSRTPGGTKYDDTQMTYTPILDEKNDKHLVEILEDFLVEDICFPRNHAQGFYTKVRECMTKKIEIED